ncbi:MAG: Na+/H+ antiporter NhaA [Acidobacteria bacterium]|nr:Na+/H+ antiporter NhaA [Acidobacteriota bacterium]
MNDKERVHETWLHSNRLVAAKFIRPLLRFTQIAAAGGVVLLVAAAVALVWANAFGDSYETFWQTDLSFSVGSFHFEETLKDIVNDALMVIFFFVVGLEIKRELVVGELKDKRRAALPAIAALGGMIVPALIYLSFAGGIDGAARGWGVPMATDIAFSMGVISLLGKRVPVGAKLFLLALAITDDIGAITVIAIFYTTTLSIPWLFTGLGGLLVVYLAGRAGIRHMAFYVAMGVFIWFAIFESGVHATLAGVALGLMTPVFPYYSDDAYYKRATGILNRYQVDSTSPLKRARVDHSALQLAKVAEESVSPLDRLEHSLHPWSAFVIVPLFALANAGVSFEGVNLGEAVTSSVALGVAAGLFVGKLVGITLFTWIAVKTGLGRLPQNTDWGQIVGLAALAGIGFTVSLFIAELAYTDVAITNLAKIGIFVGSGISGIVGYMLLSRRGAPSQEPPTPTEAPALEKVAP